MSHPIPATPRCAGTSCNRIDLIPSRLRGGAWFAWLVLVCVVTLVCRGAAVACAFRHLHRRCRGRRIRAASSFVLLEGPRAVRAIEWYEAGELTVCLGATLAPHPATLANGSFRLGVPILGFAVRDAGGDCDRCWWQEAAGTPRPSGASAGVSTAHLRGVPGAAGAPLLPSGPRFEVRHAPLKIIRLAAPRKETFAGVQGLFSSQGAGVLL